MFKQVFHECEECGCLFFNVQEPEKRTCLKCSEKPVAPIQRPRFPLRKIKTEEMSFWLR